MASLRLFRLRRISPVSSTSLFRHQLPSMSDDCIKLSDSGRFPAALSGSGRFPAVAAHAAPVWKSNFSHGRFSASSGVCSQSLAVDKKIVDTLNDMMAVLKSFVLDFEKSKPKPLSKLRVFYNRVHDVYQFLCSLAKFSGVVVVYASVVYALFVLVANSKLSTRDDWLVLLKNAVAIVEFVFSKPDPLVDDYKQLADVKSSVEELKLIIQALCVKSCESLMVLVSKPEVEVVAGDNDFSVDYLAAILLMAVVLV